MSDSAQLTVSEWTLTVLDALRLRGESLEEAVNRVLTEGLAYQQRLNRNLQSAGDRT